LDVTLDNGGWTSGWGLEELTTYKGSVAKGFHYEAYVRGGKGRGGGLGKV